MQSSIIDCHVSMPKKLSQVKTRPILAEHHDLSGNRLVVLFTRQRAEDDHDSMGVLVAAHGKFPHQIGHYTSWNADTFYILRDEVIVELSNKD